MKFFLNGKTTIKLIKKWGLGGGGGWGYDKYLFHPPRGSKNNRVPPIHMTYSIKASLNYQSETILAE